MGSFQFITFQTIEGLEKMNNKTKKALYKLISEEWLAANMYESMVLGCKAEARATIDKIFMTTADDEKNDHHLKLVRYAIQMDVDVPCRMDEYSKYAEEAVVK
jgi:ferritin-like protein